MGKTAWRDISARYDAMRRDGKPPAALPKWCTAAPGSRRNAPAASWTTAASD